MNTNYLASPWSDITRDERYFCAELYQAIKKDKGPFAKLLAEKKIIKPNELDFDIGYEVCFYRDFICRHGYNVDRTKVYQINSVNDLAIEANVREKVERKEGNKIVQTIEWVDVIINRFPPKRTFDLCLFFEGQIIIIEAKAHQGFDNEQLCFFDKDRQLLLKLFNGNIDVKVIGLYSSNYSPRIETKDFFDNVIWWSDIHQKYSTEDGVFRRADNIYKKGCPED